MTSWKKLLLWLLLMVMPVTCAMAEEQTVVYAAAPLDVRDFAHYPSYTYDAATGLWRVHANQADALLDRFWAHDHASSTALCVFHLEIEGNAQTGVWLPVLRFYYNGQRQINASAVSVLVDGVRYDLAASSSMVANGQQQAELISAPLTSDAMAVLQAMMTGKTVSVRLIGDQIYTAKLDRKATNARRSVEAASLSGLEAGTALLASAGLDAYELWDLSAKAWESRYGYAPAFAQSEVTNTLRGANVSDDFGMVIAGQQNRAARAAQEALLESGFMSGSANGIFNSSTVNATKRAQRYLGMIVTGCMDAQTEQALLAGRTAEPTSTTAMMTLGGKTELSLERYWFAKGVSAANAEASTQAALNGDNLLLVADGQIRNLSADTLYFFMQLEARVIYNDAYAYEATVACERDEGQQLDTTLMPMAQSRLVIYAELPAQLAQDASATWRIELTANGETINYDLQ